MESIHRTRVREYNQVSKRICTRENDPEHMFNITRD